MLSLKSDISEYRLINIIKNIYFFSFSLSPMLDNFNTSSTASNLMYGLFVGWIKDVAKLWRLIVKECLKLFAKKFKTLLEDFEHPIEFVITNTRLKHKLELEKMMIEPTMKEIFEHCEKGLQLADETEKRIFAVELKSLSKDWLDHPIDFILSKTKLKW